MTKAKEKSLYSVWFVVPSLAIFLIFFLWPVVSSLYYSMTVWNFETATFNGLENYRLFFTDPAMSTSVPHTLLYAFATCALKVVLAFFIAIFLTSSIKTKGFIRSAVFFPNLVSTMAVGLAFAYMMHPTKGLLNVLIQALGGKPVDFLGDPKIALWGIILTDVWKGLSISMVIYIAGIQSIDRSYYEAASIDGCNRWQIFTKVIFPLLKPIQATIIILVGVQTFNDFTNPLYFLPGAANTTVQLTLYNYKGQLGNSYNLLFADIIIITVPMLILFLFFNKRIVAGMVAGAVKG